MITLGNVLLIVALVLAAVELLRSHGQNLIAWAAAFIAAALLLPLVT